MALLWDSINKQARATLGDRDGKRADATLVVGGSDASKFVPNINFHKWDDEAWLNINYPQLVTDQAGSFSDGSARITIGDYTHRYYEDANGRLEYEIILAKRPPVSSYTLNLSFPAGLSFYRQNPLTEEQIKAGFHRPDNVIGSYAVYWNKRNNQYKTGKLCHIYRPWAEDARGDRVWGTLDIDPKAKTLTISFDPQWLRDASYPVTIGPNIGYESAGGSYWGGMGSAGVTCMYAGDPGEAGTLDSIHAYVQNYTDTSHEIVPCVYDHSGGNPSSRIAYGAAAYNAGWSSAQWVELPLSGNLSSGTAYNACVMTETGNQEGLFYDEATGPSHNDDAAGTFPTPPATYGTPDSDWASIAFSIYIEYTAGGGASSTYPSDRGMFRGMFRGMHRGTRFIKS